MLILDLKHSLLEAHRFQSQKEIDLVFENITTFHPDHLKENDAGAHHSDNAVRFCNLSVNDFLKNNDVNVTVLCLRNDLSKDDLFELCAALQF